MPDATHGAIIPNTNTTPNDPTLPASATCSTVQINAGGILNAPSSGGTLTITGANAAWSVTSGGVFNANTSTVVFSANATTVGDVSTVGSTNFYNVTISNGTLVSPAASAYMGISGTLTNSGTLAAATNENIIEFNGSTLQNIPNPNGSTPGYHNLVLSGLGYKVLPISLNIFDEFIDNTPGTGVVLAGTGTVYMNGNSIYGQTISGTSTMTNFNSLTIDNPGNAIVVNKQISVNGNLNITTGSIMDMGSNGLSGASSTTLSGSGTIYTKNTSYYPLPSGRTWSGTIIYNGTSPQYVINGTYNNLTISNTAGVTALGGLTVNGILNLGQNNPSSTLGLFSTGSYTLNMGISGGIAATTVGTGDVTGIVTRSHAFDNNTVYTFGNQYTSLTFMGISGSVKPTTISCNIQIGTAPTWKTGGVKRTYNFAQIGSGTDDVITNLHYLPSELNSNDATKIVFWDDDLDGYEQHGKTNNDVTNNWVGLSGFGINYIAPSSIITDKQWGLFNSTVVKNTWMGVDVTNPTRWDVNSNWSAGHYPGATGYLNDSVLIPTGAPAYPTLTLPVQMSTIEIQTGATVTGGSYDLTLSGATGAWLNNGTFTSSSGTVHFTNGNLSNTVTIQGTNNSFYNLQVAANTFIQPTSSCYMKISGSIIADASSFLDFVSNSNTVEYNGTNQTLINPVGSSSNLGFHGLTISGTGTKTFPSQLNIAGDFTNNGTVDALTNSTTVIMKDQGHVQNIGGITSTTFYNLTIDNTNQSVTASANINVTNALAVNASTTLDMSTTSLGGSFTSISGTGLFKTQNTTSTPFPGGNTWTFGVILNNATTAQTIPAGTFSSLQISNPTTATAAGDLNSALLTIDNGSTLDMNVHALTGGTTISGTGTLKTQNTSSTPIPSGKTWPGNVVYNGSSAQTAVAGTFGNINIDNPAGVLLASNANVIVNGTLLINSGRYLEIGTATEVNAQLVTNNAGIGGLTIKSSSTAANGTLIFNNASYNPVSGTVEMYSKAAAATYNSSTGRYSNYKWQFFGIPVTSVVASPTFDGSYVRKYEESGSNSTGTLWVSQSNGSILIPFAGYEITQSAPKTIYFQGTLVNNTQTQSLTYTTGASYPGQNIFGNPYTAAINIKQITFGTGTEASVYLYNTGSYSDWSSYSTNGNSAGQYTVAPQNTAGSNGIPGQIPSMQGFLVNTSVANATITIPYSSVATVNTDLQRVKSSTASSTASTRIDIAGNRYTDKMWVFVNPNCTRSFDNGWDGYKFLGSSLAPQLWGMEADGDYQVDAVDDLNNTELGFLTGEDTNYTLTFTHQNLDQYYSAMYLIDLELGTTTDITSTNSTYSFSAVKSTTPTKRFRIITNAGISTGNQHVENNALKVYSSFKTIFIENNSNLVGDAVITDLTGRTLNTSKFSANGLTTIPTNLSQGSYIVTVSTALEKTTKQIIIR